MKKITGKVKNIEARKSNNTGKDYWLLHLENSDTEKVCVMDSQLMSGVKEGTDLAIDLESDTSNIVKGIMIEAENQSVSVEDVKDEVTSVDNPNQQGSTNRNAKKINSAYIVDIKGKKFITANGLLDIATKEGLVSWEIEELEVNWELNKAYCLGKATFKDKRVFYGAGSSTPENTGTMTKDHFVEMAETRARGRALRTALNIDMVTAEEINK